MKYQGLIACDLDGTLLQEDSFTVSDADKAAIKKARDEGYLFALVTGRGMDMSLKRMYDWEIDHLLDIVVGSNGTQYCHLKGDNVIETWGGITKEDFSEVLSLLGDVESGIAWYTKEAVHSNYENPRAPYLAQQLGVEVLYYKTKEMAELFPFKHPKAVLFLHSTADRYVKEQIEAGRTRDYDLVFSSPTFLEVLPHGINKGTALAEILRRFNIAYENTMAIGDSENDLEMIIKSGFGVAMANGVDIVKANADFITADLTENGVALAIEEFLNRQKQTLG